MKKIKLYDYQQKMLEDIINVLTIMIDFAFFRKYPIVNYKGYSSKA